jgi:hypothetical protein
MNFIYNFKYFFIITFVPMINDNNIWRESIAVVFNLTGLAIHISFVKKLKLLKITKKRTYRDPPVEDHWSIAYSCITGVECTSSLSNEY